MNSNKQDTTIEECMPQDWAECQYCGTLFLTIDKADMFCSEDCEIRHDCLDEDYS